jgi:hypothetical protein
VTLDAGGAPPRAVGLASPGGGGTARERQSPLPKDGSITIFAGTAGSGKTTLVQREVVRQVRESYRKVLLLDPTGDILRYITEGSASRDRIPAGLCKVVHNARSARYAWQPRKRSVFEPEQPGARVVALQRKKGVPLEALDAAFIELLNDDAEGLGLVAAADEVELLYENSRVTGPVLESLKLHRNRKQTLLFAMQRPQLAHVLLRSNAARVCLFAVNSRTIVERGTAEWGDFDWDRALRLPQFRYLYRGGFKDVRYGEPLPEYHAVEDKIPWPS